MNDATNASRWRLVGLMTLIGVVGTALAVKYHLGWRGASLMTALEILVVVVHVLRTRDGLFARLLLFGLVVGIGELSADAFSVELTRTLVYPSGEPHLWASPAYMPLSWMAVMVQGGFMALRFQQRWGMTRAVLMMGLIGGSYVPMFEYAAKSAGFWYYQRCPMLLGHTPYYVILAEALLVGALPWVVKDLPEAGPRTLFGLGLLESLVILGASVVAFQLLG